MLKASEDGDEERRKASGDEDGDDVGDQDDEDDVDSAVRFGGAVAGDELGASSGASSPRRQPNTAPPSAVRKAPASQGHASKKPPAIASDSAQSVSASMSEAEDSVRYCEFWGYGFSLL